MILLGKTKTYATQLKPGNLYQLPPFLLELETAEEKHRRADNVYRLSTNNYETDMNVIFSEADYNQLFYMKDADSEFWTE